MPFGRDVFLSDDECDRVYSTFMHRIELLEEWLQVDGPNQSGAADMRAELLEAEAVVNALRRAGYKDISERRLEEMKSK